MAHDPACLLIDKNHDGPHHVPPDHPALKGKNVYSCSECRWAFHDASHDDIEDHWREHVAEAAALALRRIREGVAGLPRQMQHADPFFPETYDYETVGLDVVLRLIDTEIGAGEPEPMAFDAEGTLIP